LNNTNVIGWHTPYIYASKLRHIFASDVIYCHSQFTNMEILRKKR